MAGHGHWRARRRIVSDKQRGRVPQARVLALSCVSSAALIALVALARPGVAAASGSGTLTFTPVTGPVGTQVTVKFYAEPPVSTLYVLSVSPTGGASSTCSDAVVLPDAPKIIVMPDQQATITFIWPTELSSGAFYLCAGPAGGQTGPAVWSHWAYVVSAGPPPTATPSPPPDSGVVADVPSGGVMAGGVLTLVVDTAALDGELPQNVSLIQRGQSGAVQVNWVQVGQHLTVYTLDVSVPTDTSPGTYEVRVTGDGGLAATSNAFLVVPFAASRGGPQSVPPLISVPGLSTTSPVSALLVAVIALLLILAVASLAALLLRRRRHTVRPR